MRVVVVGILALTLVACGARTPLHVDEVETDAAIDSSEDVADTAVVDTAVEDALPDVDAPASEVGCASAAECDDGLACTEDVCDPTIGRCRHVPIDSRCDDGLFCDGEERCDTTMGCVPGKRECADAIDCTVDTCDEAKRACLHDPHDELCPISHACDVTLGCQARALAHSRTDLYDVRVPSGVVKKIGPTTGTLTDIALSPTGTLYGVSFAGLCVMDLKTGACVGPTTPLTGDPVGLDFAPDGTLYGAAGTVVYAIDAKTGVTKTVGTFPSGLSASGDIAFLGARMLVTAKGGAGSDDTLVEIDPKTGKGAILGRTGYACIWGLAAYGPTLYGLTCEGRVLHLDATTGKATQLSKVSVEFWGATAR